MQQVVSNSHLTSHLINAKREDFGPLRDLLMGPRKEIGARRDGWEGCREKIEG
jgi:hypothetical protein